MATGVGVAPSSSASVYFRPKIGTHDYTADFSKPYIVEWLVYRSVDNANAVSYLKVDDDTGPNDPDSKAFGFKIANFALYGLAYDTSLDTVDLSTTLTGSTTYRLKAWHVPGVGIFFFANGVYLGMSTHEPSGTLANAEQVIANITNGGTAVDTLLVLKAVDIRRTW